MVDVQLQFIGIGILLVVMGSTYSLYYWETLEA